MKRVQAETGVEVYWLAFELRPEGEPPPPEKPPEVKAQIRRNVERLARLHGLPLGTGWGSKSSRLAHEGAKFAAEHDLDEAWHDRIFRAQFVEGEDIAVLGNLVRWGEEIGLPGEALRRALAERRYREAVDREIALAHRIGIGGVPVFLAGNAGYFGVQTPESLIELLTGEIPAAVDPPEAAAGPGEA